MTERKIAYVKQHTNLGLDGFGKVVDFFMQDTDLYPLDPPDEGHIFVEDTQDTLTSTAFYYFLGEDTFVPVPPEPSEDRAIFYTYDFLSLNDWVFDQEKFTPYLEEDISTYRDEQIDAVSSVESVFSGETLGVTPNVRTFAAVKEKGDLAIIRKGSEGSAVNFKFKTFTKANIGDVGFRMVNTAFLQELFIAMDAERQRFFDAEEAVMALHVAEEYQYFSTARAAFDAELA